MGLEPIWFGFVWGLFEVCLVWFGLVWGFFCCFLVGFLVVFFGGRTTPVLPLSCDIWALEIGCLRERRKIGSLRPRLEDEGGWKRVEATISGGFGEDSAEGKQTDGCHPSSQISLPSSLLPSSHGDSCPFPPYLFHQPQPAQVSMTSSSIPFPGPPA